MASIRRTLSPVPLSKSSSNSQNYPSHGGVFSSSLGSVDYALYTAQTFVLGLFSQRTSRAFNRSKPKGQIWRKAFLHFLICFLLGTFLGLTPFFPLNIPSNVMPKHRDYDSDLPQADTKNGFYGGLKTSFSAGDKIPTNESFTSEQENVNFEHSNGNFDLGDLNNSLGWASDATSDKLLMIVTPTNAGPLQAYYLSRLAHTLKIVPHPLLWIVVEMDAQSMEIADLLRDTGVMYRHLICISKNSTEAVDTSVLLRNVALSHIEKHRLDGIVYFADEDKIYSTVIFEEMRKISRFGTWTVAQVDENKGQILLDGPVCNESQVIGWHVSGMAEGSRRFHAEMAGFAFNSTIIWDPKRWHRPTIEPIRQLESVKEAMQVSSFIEQIVEDESQMECFSTNILGIMAWDIIIGPHSFHDNNWFTSESLGAIFPLE